MSRNLARFSRSTDTNLTGAQIVDADTSRIIAAQLEFFKQGKAGCIFAAIAARNPTKFGWAQKVVQVHTKEMIDDQIREAIDDREVSMLSLIFPNVTTPANLLNLIRTLQQCKYVFLEQDINYEGVHCLGLRGRINSLTSWITGFGPFEFFQQTRQSPYTEITLRVKPRPPFKWVMKKAPANVIHLADLDMQGMADVVFRTLWFATFKKVEQVLGHKPNTLSAAKTSFCIPETLWSRKS
jgi:hypothetical protein